MIDVFAVIGYDSMLSVVMNGAQTAMPESPAQPLPPREALHPEGPASETPHGR